MKYNYYDVWPDLAYGTGPSITLSKPKTSCLLGLEGLCQHHPSAAQGERILRLMSTVGDLH